MAHFKYKEPIYSNRKRENDKHSLSIRRLLSTLISDKTSRCKKEHFLR